MVEPAARSTSDVDDVLVARTGSVGRILLDRPRALNALTLPMVRTIGEVLAEWSDIGLRAVTIESTSDRAFCAGGDIRRIRENSLANRHEESLDFFATEYAVNALLGRYPVPVVALVDGLCMGGGIGLSVHGPFRVVSPAGSFAMPETKIGFVPDVGATHALPRLPGAAGRYLGLTADSLSAAEALRLGVATHLCSSADLRRVPELLAATTDPVEQVLREIASTRPPAGMWTAGMRGLVDRVFGSFMLEEVMERLDHIALAGAGDEAEWARNTAAKLRSICPQSVAAADELLARGHERTLAQCLAAEYAVVREVIRTPDFIEGVRAALVDKDQQPMWGAPSSTVIELSRALPVPGTVPDFE